MKGYCLLEKFNEKMVDVQKNFNDHDLHMRKFVTNIKMNAELEKLKSEIHEKLKLFSLRKDCLNVQQAQAQRFEK
jgi:hypothetical protein